MQAYGKRRQHLSNHSGTILMKPSYLCCDVSWVRKARGGSLHTQSGRTQTPSYLHEPMTNDDGRNSVNVSLGKTMVLLTYTAH